MITLQYFCDLINADLEIRRYSNQKERWVAQFDRCEVKDGCMLCGTYGEGRTPEEAINNYLDKIKGKVLVFNAFAKDRVEYTMPMDVIY